MLKIDEETRLKVYKTFNKDEPDVEKDVNIILEWFKEQPHLPEIMNTAMIRNFLLLNKFSIEKTKQKIDNYYTIRSKIPDVYTGCNPKLPLMQHFPELCTFATHPKLLDGMYRVIFLSNTKTGYYKNLDLFKYLTNVFEIRLHEDCMAGDIYINDLANASIEQLKDATPTVIAKGFSIAQNVFSSRLKAIYYINCPPLMSKLMALLKTIVKPKICDRIHVYSDNSILKEIMSEDDLPKDYGGKGPSLAELQEIWRQKFVEYEERLDQLDILRVDESLRPKKLENDDFLGFYGNFKQLSVD